MSFFGFDPTGPKDRGHPSQGLGFGAAPDPFASISQNRGIGQDNDDEGIDFDDTYDGLGDQLEEADDDFNDDTFGGGESTTKPVGKDFDFYGSTFQASNAINEEAIRNNRQQPASKITAAPSSPPKQASKPFKTGYEAYKNPSYIPELQVDASLWGTGPPKPSNDYGAQQSQQGSYGAGASQQRSSVGAPSKKMMSLEEVEAAMRAQPKKPGPFPAPQQQPQAPSPFGMLQIQQKAPMITPAPQQQAPMPYSHAMPQQNIQGQQVVPPPDFSSGQKRIQQRPAQQPSHHKHRSSQIMQAELPTQASPTPQTAAPPQILQRGQNMSHQASEAHVSLRPRQILQNPNRHSGQLAPRPNEPPVPVQTQQRGPLPGQNDPHGPMQIIHHPSMIMNVSEEERNLCLEAEAKRAKRNHKISLLSKGNGLMTPQDKNFITRIQLQQLMTATGNVNEPDPDASLSEDFYYQVYSQIENRPRQNPQQPLSHFAQTYLFRTGGRQGSMGRRYRGGDSHMQRMEQQVQRAVEAAKAKPKNKQLVIEGSLGKISFSNAKTPKPLLNIKRHDSTDLDNRQSKKPQAALSTTNRKAILKNIEAVYSTLMKMEDHDRRQRPPLTAESDPLAIQYAIDWEQTFRDLNQQLWTDLKVTEPIIEESAILHPFITFLSYPKGKKAMPRIFNHIDENQRLTILTMVIVNLDVLDVIRLAQSQPQSPHSPSMAHEQIDLFLQAVMPSLFSYVTEAPLNIVIGMLGLVIERVNLNVVARTRVGLEILTMILSRAAIIKALDAPEDDIWDQWLTVYDRFFDMVEPFLGDIFSTSVNAGQDQYVWQFLAASGSGANPEQQQRLVLAVKDRVMETLQQGKTLPPEIASQRRGNVNLFMQAIGLDVDLLDG